MNNIYYIHWFAGKSMVILQRTSVPVAGRYSEALDWAKDVAKYINEQFKTKIEVYSQGMGDRPLGTIFWVNKYESLAQLETLSEKIGADQGYQDRLTKSVGLFVSGMIKDNIIYGPHE
jgi:hypothetical protein